MSGVLLALDQGTSSTRCIAFDAGLGVLGSAAVPVACSYPRPGLVEQDADALVDSAVEAIAGALARAGLRPSDAAVLAIANQTETFVVWERRSGRPLHPAIVWQDRRTAAACDDLAADGRAALVRERTGLEVDSTFPATKVAWLLDHVPDAAARAAAGELAYGDVASWLVFCLSGDRRHVTEASNAGRSLLCALGGTSWDDELLELFGVPAALMPPILDSDAVLATTDPGRIGAELPIAGVLGDQQASLFGQGCFAPGAAKVTLGTGAFLLVQAGTEPPVPPAGVLASCAWRRAGTTSYALEGFVPVAGAAVDWLIQLGVLPSIDALEPLLGSAGGDDVVCVPALAGLGTPTWAAGARGTLLGMTRATGRADVVRATVDGVLHQVADAVEAIAEAQRPALIRLDGGLSRSPFVVRRLADLCGVPIERAARSESTALGAAMVGGLAVGALTADVVAGSWRGDLRAEPGLGAAERRRSRERWAAARALAGALPPPSGST